LPLGAFASELLDLQLFSQRGECDLLFTHDRLQQKYFPQ
jgi:hypothetical protein